MSALQLKLLAAAAMLADHIGLLFFPEMVWLRMIGRLSFPIFCFLISEGACHTSSIANYLGRLFAAALLSEIPYDWAFTGMPFQWEEQNVIFTLFLGLCAVWALQAWQERYPIFAFFAIAACVVAAELIHCDYGGTGVLFVVVFYCCRTLKSRGTVAFGLINIGDSLLYQDRIQPFAVFAVAPVILYNGRRGKYRLRSFFYLFYPLHLLLLRIIYEVAF